MQIIDTTFQAAQHRVAQMRTAVVVASTDLLALFLLLALSADRGEWRSAVRGELI